MSLTVKCSNPSCRPASATRIVSFEIEPGPVTVQLSDIAAAPHGRMDASWHVARKTPCPFCQQLTLTLVEKTRQRA